MLYTHIFDREYNHIECVDVSIDNFGCTLDQFVSPRLKSFYLHIGRWRGTSDYTVIFAVERGAKRLRGYLEMKYGVIDHHEWELCFKFDEVDKLAAMIQDIDDGLTYIYGEKKRSKK